MDNDRKKDDGIDDETLKAMTDAEIETLSVSMMRKASQRAAQKVDGANGDHDYGRYSKTYHSSFGGEDPSLAGVKALAPAETLERHARQFAEEKGLRGDRLDAALMTEHWFRHVMRLGSRPGPKTVESMRALEKFEAVNKSDMYEATAASGGSAVPTIVANEVLKIIRDASLIYSRARQIPMQTNLMNFPDENTSVSVNWVAEGGTLTGGEPVFGTKVLTAKKIAGRGVFSLELLDDANVALMPFLQSCFAEKIGGELDFQAMEGPGTVFTGVQSAVSVGDCARTNGTNGVVLSYSSSGATVASLTQIYTKAGEGITRQDGIFVCGPSVFQKIVGLIDNNGQPIVKLGSVESQPNLTLLGRPIIVTNRMTTYTVGAGTVSVGSLYFGSPSALIFGNRLGMTFETTNAVHWDKFQGDCRLVGRFGYVVGIPAAWSKQTGIIV